MCVYSLSELFHKCSLLMFHLVLMCGVQFSPWRLGGGGGVDVLLVPQHVCALDLWNLHMSLPPTSGPKVNPSRGPNLVGRFLHRSSYSPNNFCFFNRIISTYIRAESTPPPHRGLFRLRDLNSNRPTTPSNKV